MTDLSPAAQAVLDAAVVVNDLVCTDSIAAALRAAAKQSTFADTRVGVMDEVVLVDTLLTIAAELEGE